MEDLCNKLDDLAVQYCDTLQQLTEVKQRMHNAMRQGFFNLSKARNSMGVGQVSAVQYDHSQMRAQARIHLTCLSEAEVDGTYEFQLLHCKDCKRETGKKRSDKSEGGCDLTVEDLSSLTIGEDDEMRPGQDPLHWFGILVPQVLRQSQSDFVNALRESSQLASLQSQLLFLKQQYRESLKKKAKLLEDRDKPDACS